MQDKFFLSKTLENVDFSDQTIENTEYESCVFKNCNFSNSKLTGTKFLETAFIGCNLSNVQLYKTSFQDVSFKTCKMLGLHFDKCNPFSFAMSINDCQLNHSIFYQMKLGKCSFVNSHLQGVDFTDSELKNCIFQNCDLLNAVFENTNLEKVDLRTSFNYSIDPENNRIKKAKFSIYGVSGLLTKYDIDIENPNDSLK